jgi:putative FmdB family regulatory protein
MPIYEYRCTSCGHELEALQKFADAPLATCPACQAESLTKLVSAAGFQLKGSGWYATDFKGSGKAPAKKPAGDANPAGDAKPASDAKPAGDAKSDTAAANKGESAPASACSPD